MEAVQIELVEGETYVIPAMSRGDGIRDALADFLRGVASRIEPKTPPVSFMVRDASGSVASCSLHRGRSPISVVVTHGYLSWGYRNE